MATLSSTLLQAYNAIDDYIADPITEEWGLVKSPIPITIILVSYLLFVLKLGPMWMKNRNPFEMTWLVILFNLMLVGFNLFNAIYLFLAADKFLTIFSSCHSTEKPYTTVLHAHASWWLYICKIVELLDTVLMVFKKKNSQITFFHVFHHLFMVPYLWIYIKFIPGTQITVQGFFNSAVHVIMYTYYMLAALGPRFRKFIWWKKYLTLLQLSQFITVMIYLIYLEVMNCNVLYKATTRFAMVPCIIFIYCFVNFYIKEYSMRSKKREINGKQD